MTTAKFWKIIAESKERAGGDSERQMEILTEMLAATSLKEIQKFNNRFYSYFFKSYTWDLWGAAFVALGGCSDDAFMNFRGWLIAQGKEVFETALKDPESLVDYAPLENPGIMEGFSYCASDAYGELGGGELDFDASWVTNYPRGEFWVEAWLPKRFPRLWQKFGKKDTGTDTKTNVNTTDTPATESNDFSNPDLELIKELIAETPDINATLENGKTPLLYAAAKNPNPEAIKLIIAAGAKVNYLTEDGNFPSIYAAAKNQNPEIIKVLISAGADINIANKNGFTALMHAAEYSNNPEIINTLITAGANVNAENHSIPESESVITALTLACGYNKNPDIITALIKAGANVNINREQNGLTPLMFAALKNPEPEVIRVLAEAGADLNVEAGGATALNFAAQNENPAVTEMLMSLMNNITQETYE
jgi:ankyrin repeat protein